MKNNGCKYPQKRWLHFFKITNSRCKTCFKRTGTAKKKLKFNLLLSERKLNFVAIQLIMQFFFDLKGQLMPATNTL